MCTYVIKCTHSLLVGGRGQDVQQRRQLLPHVVALVTDNTVSYIIPYYTYDMIV